MILPKTKPIVVGMIYQLPSQNSLLKILNKNFPSIDTDAEKNILLVILT